MLVTNLPNIREAYAQGDDLRWDTSQAVTRVEEAAARGAGGVASAATLRDFFIAAANAAHAATGDKLKTVKLA
ncbi:hypothetical protein BGV67_02750 [Burkholderia ubonensis]|uniref:hypothetical protein n=1 Tax=Burkholderia ubonensis TaxID=101571 RepID=UPI00075A7C61|nr:hypothetical protein [Burkholderia ubonensis]KVD50610.1 hypothetical protein WI86_15950 [Burkholderia ubonensis]KVD54749.1 hypothetical protein WI87_23925 [Burkholderia ubonensis]KWI10936.1 hypothetical protein WM01_19485 [Burkholderia ubonensis]KWK57275.1 hypothetical protein WM15_18035 [Burkholderia ubonensis]OJA76047.1 hypothetical protein BGV67_02750 [Burkholderia ubonensis]